MTYKKINFPPPFFDYAAMALWVLEFQAWGYKIG